MHMNRKFAIRLTTSVALLLMLSKVSIGTYVVEQTRIIHKRDVTNGSTFINVLDWRKLSCKEFPLLNDGYYLLQIYDPIFTNLDANRFLPMLRQTYFQRLLQKTSQLKTILQESLKLGSYEIAAFDFSQKCAKNGLDAAVVYVYTTKYIYKQLNEALRTGTTFVQTSDTYIPVFALVLNAVLMYSKNMTSTNATTYRKMHLSDDDIKKYTEGTTFVWTHFTSSSLNQNIAKNFTGNVLFIFNNSKNSLWQPRKIDNFSDKPEEQEALYPSGAMFKVISVVNQTGLTIISVELMDQCPIALCGSRKKRDTDNTCPMQPVDESSSHTASQGISLPKISYVTCICVYFIFGTLVLC